MEASQSALAVPAERRDVRRDHSQADPLAIRSMSSPVRRAIIRTRQWLLDQQDSDGSWCAELEGATILESETILLWAFLGCQHAEQAQRAAKYLVERQLPEGGWEMYPGGGLEISGSVKAYFALKLTGHDPGSDYMQRAREAIMAAGGADAVNSYTRFYLALLGQISYDQCPAVPPEVMLLPKWFPANIYAISSWSRTIIVPLSIISAMQPVREIDPRLGIRELFLADPQDWPPLRCPGLPGGTGMLSWDRFFRKVDGILKWCQRYRLVPLRKRAISKAEEWMLEHFQNSDGLGAIYPPIVWSIIALQCLGYADDSPEVEYCHEQLADLIIDEEDSDSIRIQPCRSPVWDTAIACRSLELSGIKADSLAMRRALDWLLDKQVKRPGDWTRTVKAEPGGWCFEYANSFYPDSDDTAMVLMALQSRFQRQSEASRRALPPQLRLVCETTVPAEDKAAEIAVVDRTAVAIERGVKWMLAMQNNDGGWGAFDRNNDRQFLCYVPFADHNAMIDPSTADVTGRVLESLGRLGRRLGDPAVDRAVEYVRREQQPDGSWFGRWGVNYIYGTWEAMVGLLEVGVSKDDPAIQMAVNWLLAHQQDSGGWGESANSYEKPELRGQGPVTASQTAWALLGLTVAGLQAHPAVVRGIGYLLDSQEHDGTWDEPEFTGTGFPRVFYLKYHYYPICFPLMALAQWAVKVEPLLLDDRAPELQVVGVEARG